ncbi:hypothetical protein [Jannaschia donghaensis]|uniref:Uncharacterized protein n=1 Tax=Jannaschia donghaensis TaxID=420998 RepID=A0A0M6YNA5_9RHOB|nr:hypothetical protein [Jannaschia donghaensis]CTQ51364.1 hypothetical protein JDO7802_03403 [Jannaschia donghaensis]
MGKGDNKKSNKEVKKPKKEKPKGPFVGEAGAIRGAVVVSGKKVK